MNLKKEQLKKKREMIKNYEAEIKSNEEVIEKLIKENENMKYIISLLS